MLDCETALIANQSILDADLTALFCSGQCPGDVILKMCDFARAMRDAGVPVIGGLQSPIEKECLRLLLRGDQPVVVCPARGIEVRPGATENPLESSHNYRPSHLLHEPRPIIKAQSEPRYLLTPPACTFPSSSPLPPKRRPSHAAFHLILRCRRKTAKSRRLPVFGLTQGKSLSLSVNRQSLADGLSRLDALADGAGFIIGHNIIDFDLPHLRAANPSLRLLQLPVVDTLRLNPLAFPRNPYHHLVKHYQDGQLRRGRINDPLLDAQLTLDVLNDQLDEFKKAPWGLLTAWHWLTTSGEDAEGFDMVFSSLRYLPRPTDEEALAAIKGRIERVACTTATEEILADVEHHGWPLAYALAWLSVSGGNSVMPPWVMHQFPEAGALVRRLRDNACTEPYVRVVSREP